MAAAGRRIGAPALVPPQTLVPDSSRRLSDGLVIETSVLARLLGVKLLTLEGTVLVSPAQIHELGDPSTASAPTRGSTAAPRQASGNDRPAPRQDSMPSPRLDEAPGTRLGLAARMIHESSDDLRDLDHP